MKKITRGMRNNNPFNIRKSSIKWYGKISGKDKEFETFDTLEHGYRAGLVLLRTYYTKYKLHSCLSIILRFAPPSENNVNRYLSFIWTYSRIAPEDFISLNTLLWKIAPLIAKYESNCTLPDSVVKQIIYNVNKEYE